MSGVYGATYSLQLPVSASGVYTVSVAVTDGSRVTQTNWTINVAARHAPRVLFDESHGESDTIDPATANQRYSQHRLLDLVAGDPGDEARLSSFAADRGTHHRAGP